MYVFTYEDEGQDDENFLVVAKVFPVVELHAIEGHDHEAETEVDA